MASASVSASSSLLPFEFLHFGWAESCNKKEVSPSQTPFDHGIYHINRSEVGQGPRGTTSQSQERKNSAAGAVLAVSEASQAVSDATG